MDGNRRWAQSAGLLDFKGHEAGVEPIKTAVNFCTGHRIPYLTLYAFSTENFERSKEEIDHLFSLITKKSDGLMNELKEQNVRIRIVGDQTKFPEDVKKWWNRIEDETKDGKALTLTLLFGYSGRDDLAHAARAIGQQVAQGTLDPDKITIKTFKKNLLTAHLPDADLLIRTGAERRLSNFLPFQSAYSELYFVDTLWPAMQRENFEKALTYFEGRSRRFGR